MITFYILHLANMGKFAAFFKGVQIEPPKRSKSDMSGVARQNVARRDFGKALNPRQSMETMIKQPMISRERSDPARDAAANNPYHQFAEPYRGSSQNR